MENSPLVEQFVASFLRLPPIEQAAAMKELGRKTTGHQAGVLWENLDPRERDYFNRQVVDTSWMPLFIPLLRAAAQRIILGYRLQGHGVIDLDEWHLLGEVSRSLRCFEDGIRENQTASLREKRDRASSPEIIRRNYDIIQMHYTQPQKWTVGKLAKHFKLTRQRISQITKEQRSDWLKKYQHLSTNKLVDTM